MNNVISLLELKKIDFQIDTTNVLITCYLQREKEEFVDNYYVSHSEMNKIIGELQLVNPNVSIYDAFFIIQLNDNETLYSLDLHKNELQNSYHPPINHLFLSTDLKQIRA
jgi:hypothetical protein